MIRDLLINESQEMLEINQMMSGESEKTPDIIKAESEDLITKINESVISIESALTDLNGKLDNDMLEKYEELTGESGMASMILDNWTDVAVNVIERIVAFIKRIYNNAIVYLKKVFVKFLYLINKQQERAIELLKKVENKELDKNKIVNNIAMYISSDTGNVDIDILNKLFSSEDLRNVLGIIRDINNTIIINIPKKEVFTDSISGNVSSLNDMIRNYEEIIIKKYKDVTTKGFYNRILNENLNKLVIVNNNRIPFVITSNGNNGVIMDMDDMGKLTITTVPVKDGARSWLNSYDIIKDVITEMSKQDVKKIVETDFKILEQVKKEADAYLNQSKRYVNLDVNAINLYGNNLTVTLSAALTFSSNRLSLANRVMNILD